MTEEIIRYGERAMQSSNRVAILVGIWKLGLNLINSRPILISTDLAVRSRLQLLLLF